MDKITFQNELRRVNRSCTLLTPKHDPNSGYVLTTYTSVLTHEASSSLDSMIELGDYEIYEYHNNNPYHHGAYFVLEPGDSSYFSIAASGISPYSTDPPIPLDKIVLVSGSCNGFHVFGENQREIDNKVVAGEFTFLGKLI